MVLDVTREVLPNDKTADLLLAHMQQSQVTILSELNMSVCLLTQVQWVVDVHLYKGLP